VRTEFFFFYLTSSVADPDLQIRGGGGRWGAVIQTLDPPLILQIKGVLTMAFDMASYKPNQGRVTLRSSPTSSSFFTHGVFSLLIFA